MLVWFVYYGSSEFSFVSIQTNQTDSRQTLHASRCLLRLVSRRVTGKPAPSPDQWLQLAVRALARSDRTTAQIERLLAAKGASPSQVRARFDG